MYYLICQQSTKQQLLNANSMEWPLCNEFQILNHHSSSLLVSSSSTKSMQITLAVPATQHPCMALQLLPMHLSCLHWLSLPHMFPPTSHTHSLCGTVPFGGGHLCLFVVSDKQPHFIFTSGKHQTCCMICWCTWDIPKRHAFIPIPGGPTHVAASSS